MPLVERFRIHASCDSKQVKAVLDEIDYIHKAPHLPEIQVVTVIGGVPGEFDPDSMTLRLAAGDEHPHTTLVHEVGHILDLFGFDPNLPDYASRCSLSLFREWDNAVRASNTYRRLRQRLEREETIEIAAYLRYLVDPVELWARSYAQFIARRSGRFAPGIARDMDGIIRQGRHRGAIPEQWPSAEFGSIDAAIERMLESMSWLR